MTDLIVGDQFLFIAIRTSPFFPEPSTFEADFEYDGRGKIHNLTMYRIVNRGVSPSMSSRLIIFLYFFEHFQSGNFAESGSIATPVIKIKIKMDNVYHAESVMKIYGFKNP